MTGVGEEIQKFPVYSAPSFSVCRLPFPPCHVRDIDPHLTFFGRMEEDFCTIALKNGVSRSGIHAFIYNRIFALAEFIPKPSMRFLSFATVFFLWLLHFLPLALLSPLGRGLGRLLYSFGKHRRRIVETNLRLCFPDLDPARRVALAKAHFQVLGRSLLERGLLWWSRPERLRRLIRIEVRRKSTACSARERRSSCLRRILSESTLVAQGSR
jgi:hypothetical protein